MKIKKIKPMFTSIVTTMDEYKEDQYVNGIIDPTKVQKGVKEYQKVLAVGDSVRGIKVGDIVCIDPKNYAVPEHSPGSLKDGIIKDNIVKRYHFNVIELDGKQCLLLQDRDISFVIEEFEE